MAPRARRKPGLGAAVSVVAAAAAVVVVLACVLGVAAGQASAAVEADGSSKTEDFVVNLDSDMFDTKLTQAGTDFVLVEFYAPWCAVCQTLAPEVELAGRLAYEHDLPVTIATLDVDAFEDVKERFDIKSTPTFKLFSIKEQGMSDFPLFMYAEAIISALHDVTLPDAATRLSPAKLFFEQQPFLSWLFWRGTAGGALNPALVLVSPPDDTAGVDAAAEAAAVSAFETVARDMVQTLRFAHVVSSDVVALLKAPVAKPSIFMYVEHDEGRFAYDGPMEVAALKEFVARHMVPMVTTVHHKNLKRIAGTVQLLVHIFVPEDIVDAPKPARVLQAQLAEVAAAILEEGLLQRGDFTLAVTNGNKYSSWKPIFGLDKDAPLPVVGGNNVAAHSSYTGPADIIAPLGAEDMARLEEERASNEVLREHGLLPEDSPELEPALSFRIDSAALLDFVRGMELGVAPPFQTDVTM